MDLTSCVSWFRGSSIRIRRSGREVQVDPWGLTESSVADYILLTHPHYDNFSEADIACVREPGTVVIAPTTMKKQLEDADHFLRPGDMLQFEGLDGLGRRMPDLPRHRAYGENESRRVIVAPRHYSSHPLVARPAASSGTSAPTIRCEGMSSRVWFPDLKTASTLENVRRPSGATSISGPRLRGSAAFSLTAMRPPGKAPPVRVISPARTPPPRNPLLKANRMLRVRLRSAITVAPVDGAAVWGESAGRRVIRFEGTEDGSRSLDPRLHRVVDPLERWDIHKSGCVPHDQAAIPVAAFRNRIISSLGNGLGAPLHQLAPLQLCPKERMELQPLKQLVHVEPRVPVVEPHDQSERHQPLPHRIHEAAPEGVAGQRPSEGMDDAVEGTLYLPELLHSQGIDLRIRRSDSLPFEPPLGEEPPGALREHSDFRGQVQRGLSSTALPVPAGGNGAHTDDALALDEQSGDRESGEDVDAELLGLLPQPTHDLAERCHPVPVVAHRGRRGDGERALLTQDVDGLSLN